MNQQNRSPQETRLDIFVGDWQNAGRVMPGRFGPGGDVVGTTRYYWAVGEKWLQYVSKLELPGLGPYEVQGGVVYNPQTKKYDAYAVNSMGALMVYEGQWLDETTLAFLLTHPGPSRRARVVYQVLPDGYIHMNSDNLLESGEFETYFETGMVRVE